MKRPHRDFVVEIKSSRRIPKSKSSSIWGSLDLKAHAAEITDQLSEEVPVVQSPVEATSVPDIVSPHRLSKSDARPVGQEVSVESKGISDPTIASTQDVTNVDEELTISTSAENRPQKRRGRQWVSNASRGARPKTSDKISETGSVPIGRRKRQPTKKPGVALAGAKVLYDIDKELAELEAENKRLKKLFADRLHAENAELKRKLGIR